MAQLVGHRHDKPLVEETHCDRHGNDSPSYYDALHDPNRDKKQNAAADYQRVPPIAPAPRCNCGVYHKDH